MRSQATRRAATAVLATAALAAPVYATAVSSAQAATPLHCHAWVSDSTPKQYSDAYVHVRTRPHAHVHTVAHYKTSDTPHNARANRHGRAVIDYYISGATPGYRVKVNVTVRKLHRVGHCATSFTPHR